MLGQRYQLVQPAYAIFERDGKQTLVHLRAGALVKVDACRDEKRMVEVAYERRTLLMFTQDLRERGIQVP